MAREIQLHSSILKAWDYANKQAMMAESERIQAAHFLLAVFILMDYEDGIDYNNLPGEESESTRKEVQDAIKECKGRIGLSDDDLTRTRRGIQKKLLLFQPSFDTTHTLHRSDEMRRIFHKCSQEAVDNGRPDITLPDLFNMLLQNIPEDLYPIFEGVPNIKSSGAKTLVGQPQHQHRPQAAADQKTPAIDQMGRDLTALAKEGKLPPIVGRKSEMTMAARFLMRTSKQNVILVGPAGVGKTAVVEGLAQQFVKENAPDYLRNLRIVQINIADLVAGTRYRGDMEERLKRLLEEAAGDPNLVLFLDEIHLVMKSGGAGDSAMDIANILKPALSRDQIRCIGATTTEEFERYIKEDSAFMRRFQVIHIGESTPDETLQICQTIARHIEEVQKVRFDPSAVESAVALSVNYIHDRYLPDKAIDLLENAAAYAKVTSLSFREIPVTQEYPLITGAEIRKVLEEQYGINVQVSDLLDTTRIGNLLHLRVIGQDAAVDQVVEVLNAAAFRPSASARPLSVMLLTGPTGVGKTYMAECLEEAIFNTRGTQLLRLNMNEYKEPYDLSRLTGAAPGLIGHDRPGALYGFVAEHSQGVILLDEFEKAHPDVMEFFMQIFDKGESIDSRGHQANFRQFIFILTSNLSSAAAAKKGMGFLQLETKQNDKPDLKEVFRKYFPPELLGRMDRIIEFKELAMEDYKTLLRQYVDDLSRKLAGRQIRAILLDSIYQNMGTNIAIPIDGVRGFQRWFENTFSLPLENWINNHPKPNSPVIKFTWENMRVVMYVRNANDPMETEILFEP